MPVRVNGIYTLGGGWAYLINSTDDKPAFLSAIIQGCASAVITLAIIAILSFLILRIPKVKGHSFLITCITVSTTGSGLYLLHTMANTPKVIETITPPLCVAFIFSWVTAHKLKNKRETHG